MIHIFRTSVETQVHAEKIGSELNTRLSAGAEWSFDLDDCDRVLRVVNGGKQTVAHCKEVLQSNGFTCEELID